MYSQYLEERYILECCGETGLFLDIGAYHPTEFSNTRALYEKGWDGVLVEPSPGPFLNLARACSQCGDVPDEPLFSPRAVECSQCGSTIRYGNDPRLKLVNAAITPDKQLIPLHITNYATTTSEDSVLGAWRTGAQYFGKFWVLPVTLEEIFAEFGRDYGFISIDTEGTSVSIAFRMLELNVLPQCICIEHDNRIVEIMGRFGEHYRAEYINGTNIVLSKRG